MKGVSPMDRSHKWLFLAVLAGAMVLIAGLCWARSDGQAQAQAQKKVVEQQKQDPEEPYTEEEYNAYEQATKEPDLAKREAALIAFMDKYPKSKLQVYIVTAYETLLADYYKSGDYKKLEPAAEKWLKYKPNDLRCIAFITESAQKTGQDKKVVEYGEKLFAQKPSPEVALLLFQSYQKTGDKVKELEFAQKLLEYPEYNDNFELRMMFVSKYANEKNGLTKAAEYAQLALKSFALAKKPAGVPEADWNKASVFVRRTCYDIIGMNLVEQKKYAEAIPELEKALKVEKYDSGYYYIAYSQWMLKDYEDAYLNFAVAELLKGPMQAQAKSHFEELYKEVHNGNLTGSDKIYRKAQIILNGGDPNK